MSKLLDDQGVALMYEGKRIKHLKVNPKMRDVLEPCLDSLAEHGCVELETLGIIYNRPIRGKTEIPAHTSKHSEGLCPDYKAWGDGTHGSRAMDVVSVTFDNGDKVCVSDDHQRAMMVHWCEERGWKVYHQRPGSISPDHIHIEV